MIRTAIFHSDGDSENNPNAAPRFCTCVRRKIPGTTTTESCRRILRATSHLDTRSRTMTSTAIRTWYLRMISGCDIPQSLDASLYVRCYSTRLHLTQSFAASLANRRILCVLANVDGIIPATVALYACCFCNLDVNALGAVSSRRLN